MEGMIGEIRLFAGNFAPRGWALCNGQLLSIAQNTALFSILGTTYGGDGRVTFALPDLRGRTAAGVGQGPGLTPLILGEVEGSPNTSLITTEMPMHTHLWEVSNAAGSGSANSPANAVPAVGPVNRSTGQAVNTRFSNTSDGTIMSPMTIGITGNSIPYNNMQPSLVLNYIICMEGIFPSRN